MTDARQRREQARTPPQLLGPNLAIGTGIVILVAYVAVIAWLLRPGADVDHGILIVFAAGIVIYILVMVICGAGILWADRVVRNLGIPKPGTTLLLVKVAAALLVLPWVVLPFVAALFGAK